MKARFYLPSGKARIARRRRLRKKREEEEEEEKKKEEEEKKKEEEEKYLAHALSPPAGRLRAVTALVVAFAARGQLFSQSSPNSNSPNSNPAYPGFPCLLDLLIRDAYMLNIFENNQTRLPSWCNALEEKLPFCQILGYYRMELPQYNTIEPYAHMNENCPSLPPAYTRPERC
ncbi:hypothetical protein BHM03_00014691 [Ensete ventricosum]|nr:hypothetical protein BHM03_00014691 [Ensete ventricosum]